jgi:hypothetical protein
MTTIDEHILALGNRLQLRKKHPCGGDEWLVVRLGADIGLQCVGCGRSILLPRTQLRKQMKKVLSVQNESDD